ncbi:hypothetical protein Rsub_02714 [Raphidocelis subcapitata]|uniref:Pseudouridine synthase RsuA/RluA-like domain-containing protein n=1 Tax=Raphidocelis subcapitata TaxID=307507 RepID=A0A2V0NQQ9_9CHLO|nr:hypothetical protein Rsub_02714 [Raphidocelis subcapitata]|eukprot:GBF90008.1 hypothetical protein Rsub_02714 [Raphidocelis subcapitata]
MRAAAARTARGSSSSSSSSSSALLLRHRMRGAAAGRGPASAAAAPAPPASCGGDGEPPRRAAPRRGGGEPQPLKRHMRVVETAVAPPGFAPARLPEALRALLPHRYPSDTAAKKACRRGEVLVNGAKGMVEDRVEAGATIEIVQRCGSDPVAAAGRPGLGVVFEDDHMACVVKPQGLPTQGGGEGTLQGRIKYCLAASSAEGCLPRPHQAHRLDAATGGLVLVGKTRRALAALSGDLSAHRMQKRYTAIVHGRLDGEGVVDWQLDGRPAVTLFRAVAHAHAPPAPQQQQAPAALAGGPGWAVGGEGSAAGGGGGGGGDAGAHGQGRADGWLTRVHLWPKTGRTHQLRKHMAYIGHPILGDPLYRHHHIRQGVAAERRDIGPLLAGMLEHARSGGGGAGGDGGDGGEAGDGGAPDGSAPQRPSAEAGQGGGGAEEAADAQGGEEEDEEGGSDKGGAASAAGGGQGAGGAAPVQPMCLWAVELRLRHPVTREPLHLSIPDPPAYGALCPLDDASAT